MEKVDVVVALFGEKYKQWNTATDLAAAITLGKSTIMIRPEEFIHALKEFLRKTNAIVSSVDQAVEVLAYVLE